MNAIPKISIIIPIYNVEKYLHECLESVVNQTLKEIEIICVNDGSTDSSLEIMRGYQKDDNRIRIIDKANSGYGNSMNMGILAAKGKYIGIVESDDFIEPEMFERLFNEAEENNADVVKSNFWLYWNSEETIKDELHEYFSPQEDGLIITPSEYDDGSMFYRKPSIWSAIYRREFLEKNNIGFLETPGASFQDTSFTFKIYTYAEIMVCLYDAFLHYRQDNANSSVNNIDKKLEYIFQEYEEIRKIVIDNKSSDKDKEMALIKETAFYDTCMWAYENLKTHLRYPYLKKISAYFTELNKSMDFSQLKFDNCPWKYQNIELVVNNPLAYHTLREVERFEEKEKTDILQFIPPVTAVGNELDFKTSVPFFSVIVPVYNVEKYLSACLESIMHQSFMDFECIVVCDGNVDHSLSVAEQYTALDDRFVILHKHNGGLSSARNAGLRAARGKYVFFVDADDYLSENALERVSREYKKYSDTNIIIFGSDTFPKNPPASEWYYNVLKVPNLFYKKINEKQFFSIPCFKVFSWRLCFKKSYLTEHDHFFDEKVKFGEDVLFAFDAVLHAENVACISDKLYNYRHFRNDSLMEKAKRTPVDFFMRQMKIFEIILQKGNEKKITSQVEMAEYVLDFIFSAFQGLTEAEKRQNAEKILSLLEKYGLSNVISNTNENCVGFYRSLNVYQKTYKQEQTLLYKFKKLVSLFLPTSRKFAKRIGKLEQISGETLYNSRLLLKKYDDDMLWLVPKSMQRVENIEKILKVDDFRKRE